MERCEQGFALCGCNDITFFDCQDLHILRDVHDPRRPKTMGIDVPLPSNSREGILSPVGDRESKAHQASMS